MINFQSILGRRSQPLIGGEIDRDELQSILSCALTAPDHKRLRPWRYIVCHPEHKEVLTWLIVSSLPETSADLRENQVEQVRRKLGFAPHIVICLLEFNRSCTVPEVEQVLSAGAAIQNMIIAAEGQGHKCYWKTGEWAYNMRLHEKLSLNPDTIITAFLGFGKNAETAHKSRSVERAAYADHFISIEELVTPDYLAEAVELGVPRF